MTQAFLLNKPSHQPKIVKSTILWLAELRQLEKADTESPRYGKLNKTKARISWKHFLLFHFIYLFRWEATYVLRYVHEGQDNSWESILSLYNVSPKDQMNSDCQECTASPFTHWALSAIHVMLGILFLQLESSSSQECVCGPRATCMGSGTHATTNLQRSEDNLWGSVHSVPPGLRQVSHHYASQTSWPSSPAVSSLFLHLYYRALAQCLHYATYPASRILGSELTSSGLWNSWLIQWCHHPILSFNFLKSFFINKISNTNLVEIVRIFSQYI